MVPKSADHEPGFYSVWLVGMGFAIIVMVRGTDNFLPTSRIGRFVEF
jgi:hypothetical protein